MEFRPMSPDEIERTMQFLLRQQAQFAADSEKQSIKLDRMAEAVVGLTGSVGRVVESIGRVAEAQQRTDEQIKATDQQLRDSDARLTEHITTVESHLNILIEMFERHLREDHGRRPS